MAWAKFTLAVVIKKKAKTKFCFFCDEEVGSLDFCSQKVLWCP